MQKKLSIVLFAALLMTVFSGATCLADQTHVESATDTVFGFGNQSLHFWVHERPRSGGNEVYRTHAQNVVLTEQPYMGGYCGIYYQGAGLPIAREDFRFQQMLLPGTSLWPSWQGPAYYYIGPAPYQDVLFAAWSWWEFADSPARNESGQSLCHLEIDIRLWSVSSKSPFDGVDLELLEPGIYYETEDGLKRLREYDIPSLQQFFLTLLDEKSEDYICLTLLESEFLRNGSFAPWADQPQLTDSFVRFAHSIEMQQEMGDCVSLLFLSRDGQKAFVGAVKADGSMRCYALDVIEDALSEPRLAFGK